MGQLAPQGIARGTFRAGVGGEGGGLGKMFGIDCRQASPFLGLFALARSFVRKLQPSGNRFPFHELTKMVCI